MTTFNFCVQILYTVENARGAGKVIAAGIMIKPYNIYGIILIGACTAFDSSNLYSPPNGGVIKQSMASRKGGFVIFLFCKK